MWGLVRLGLGGHFQEKMEGKCKRSKCLGLFREQLIKFSLHEVKKGFPTSSQKEFEGPDKNLGFILNLKGSKQKVTNAPGKKKKRIAVK